VAVTDKTNVASTATDGVFRSLLRVLGLIKRMMEPYFAGFGISGSQWGVLIILYHAKTEGLSGLWLKDIGNRLLVRPPSVSGVVSRLQLSGLVSCETSLKDSRAKQISLTPAGCELVDRILAGHQAKINDILGGLNSDERLEMHQLLNKMCSHLEKIEQYKEESTVY
jgi:DNA-binding MarR family transcriptional regulator